ncbi:UDP-N-acetylmuramoylalanine--D-glutamate ligase [Rhizobiales bacterium GAS113]|nr:UDP-N-acetylmuramoylalanine--D-glutamate ligase [Rhizobiales bacterium GAS113]
MTPVTCMRGKRLALFGLGGSGLATARALVAGGAVPICWDDAPASLEEARREGFTVEDLRESDWRQFAALVLAPGVPLTHPKPHWTVELAKAAAVEVIGDIELFGRERRSIAPGSPFIAVTGTNGKSTTTALIAHILREARCDVQMGGNIGTPILALELPAPNRFHVIECSSFQIDLAPSLAPSIGVLLNITPDHLDRHGTMENYSAIKERLVDAADIAVVGIDDAKCVAVFDRLRRRMGHESPMPVGRLVHEGLMSGLVGFAYADAQILEIHGGGTDPKSAARSVASLANIPSLRGEHNAQNAAAAFAVVCCAAFKAGISLSNSAIAASIKTFPGLPHRMEEVGRSGSVIFINDSKATNADSTEKALLSFESGIFWILGGKSKEGGIEPLRPLLGRVEKAYLIGAASEEFAATLSSGKIAHESCGTLELALSHAARDAAASGAEEPVVLLSPACASYDQFKNFEERGDRFRDLVHALISQAQAAGRISPALRERTGGAAR